MAEIRPPLSVVIAATQPWPEIRGCLDSLYAQACAAGAEILVADGTGRALPENSPYPEVRCLESLGATVFQLRALAMAAARGEIVAVTEDHCRVAPDWCAQILRAHREFPDAAVIGGAVENGATGSLIDWANFLASNDRFLMPIPIGEQRDIPGQANISYKGRVVPSDYPAIGIVESHLEQALSERGERFVSDDKIVVEHVQSLGWWGSCFIHYHDGRTIGGFHLPYVSFRTRMLRIAKCLALPARVLVATARITLRTMLRKPRHRRVALLSSPLVALLLCFHTAGELTGYVAGPGKSPTRMR